MIFSQWAYFLLLALSVVSFFLVPKTYRRWVLIISGIVFYGYFAKNFLLLILLEILILYLLLLRRTQLARILALALPILLLVFFKYRHLLGISLFSGSLVVPLAISFFTFEFVHFVIETNRHRIRSASLSQLAAFIFFFPTLVAGPIKRFPHFNRQINQARFSPPSAFFGSLRIIIGLAKKLVLADTFAAISGQTLLSKTAISAASPLSLWLALFSYSFRIYFDFSGYSDIAIGSARLFGIIIPENFILPYLRTNIATFWKNWHRTLYTWVVDYIFIPLGGNRQGLLKAIRNTLITMAVSGIWHGAAWHFLAWGLYHGVLLSGYRLYKTYLPSISSRLFTPISVMITFTLVSLGWLLFIAPVDIAVLALAKMLGFNL